MKKLFVLAFALLTMLSTKGQIVKIDHFNAHTADARVLFELFKTTFKLPIVYDYQSYDERMVNHSAAFPFKSEVNGDEKVGGLKIILEG